MNIEQKYLNLAIKAAKDSSVIFKKYFAKAGVVEFKNNDPRDLVTKIDQKIETEFRKIILKNFPTHKIIGEEFGSPTLEKNDLVWIIDPIDGTTNYIQGVPICCISIALWDNKGPLVAVVYNPILDQLYKAARGKGAFLNGKKIKVSTKASLQKSFGGYAWGHSAKNAVKNFPKFVKSLNKIRTFGSSAMEISFIAKGSYDFHISSDIKIWDFAAAVLFVLESGGKVSDWEGQGIGFNTTNLIASNDKLHNQLLTMISKK